MRKKVLIVYYSLGGNTKKAAQAVRRGVEKEEGEVVMKTGVEAGSEDLLHCDGLAIGTPDYFNYMAGGLKDFFDRTFYPTQGEVTDKPCTIFVTHGGGGKAVESVRSVCRTFKFKLIGEPVLVKGSPGPEDERKLEEMGSLLVRSIR